MRAAGFTARAICFAFVRTPLVEQQIAAQAKAQGISEDRVLEDVILQPHAVKRLLEPQEVADAATFLPGARGRAFTARHGLGWSAR